MTPSRVAVLGLGLMGGTFASHLLADGHRVAGYDPDEHRRREHLERGGTTADNIGEAIVGCELIVLSLPNSTIALEVCAAISQAVPENGNATTGRLVIDTTTGDPEDSIRAAELLSETDTDYVDATVSGNAAQAGDKDIIFMIGGADRSVARATDLLSPLCRRVYHVGGVASGSRAKLVVNHILSINRAAVAEGLTVAEKAGVDLAPMLEILKDSAAYSKAMDIWGERMVAADHDPPNSRVRQSVKDSRIINEHAQAIGASRELVDATLLTLTEAVENGLADADNSAVMEVMRRRAGIGRIP